MIHFLICAALFAAPAEAAKADDALAQKVGSLVRQLDAPQLSDRDASERQLLALGPQILSLLPVVNDRTPAEVALRLGRLRQQLLRQQALAATRPSLVTLKGDGLPLSSVLVEISKQTGNPTTDHRANFGQRGEDPKLKVDFDKTPFWQALDSVLDQAGLTLYGFAGENDAFVVNRPGESGSRAAKACYAGVFRLEPLKFEAQRDLRNEELGALRLLVEVSWEPRLRPIAILQPLGDISAVTNSGETVPPANRRAEPETMIRQGFSSTQLEIPLALPQRTSETIRRFKGKLLALVPGPLTDFRFKDLPLATGAARAKPVEQRQGGTVVTLEEVRKNNEVWQARLRVQFEAPGAALESHRSWVLENEAFFEDAAGKRIAPGGLEQTMHSKDTIGINYLFDLPDGIDGRAFVYRTPLVIVELPVEYEFRDLRLP